MRRRRSDAKLPKVERGKGHLIIPEGVGDLLSVIAEEVPVVKWLSKFYGKAAGRAAIKQIESRIAIVMHQIRSLREKGVLREDDLVRPEILGRIFEARRQALKASTFEKLEMLAAAFRYAIVPNHFTDPNLDRIISIVGEMAPEDAVALRIVVRGPRRSVPPMKGELNSTQWTACLINLFRLGIIEEETSQGSRFDKSSMIRNYSQGNTARASSYDEISLALTPLGNVVRQALESSAAWPKEAPIN